MASPGSNGLALIKAVLDLVADRRAGVLEVRADGVRTRIYFEDGKPLFAEDEAPGETFGRLLVRQGVIGNDEFVRVIDEMTRAATGDDPLRFGEVAVGLGVLTPEQVERGLAEQVCGIIARALQRDESQWTFEPSPGAARAPRSFSLAINPAVLAAMRQSPDTSIVAGVVAARPEQFVVPAAGARVSDGSAANQVRVEAGTPAAEKHAARMAAEQAFQRGIALLRATKTAPAAMELHRASELQPESLEYLLYAAWARARSYREIPGESDQQTLLELAQRAKRRDPMFAFGSYVIGQLSMWAGDDATAKKWFYEALRLDPASEAGQQVRILARRGIGAPAPVPTREPPAPDTRGTPPSKAPSSRWAKRLLPGAALLATAALVVFAAARKSVPRAGLAASASRAGDSDPKDAFSPPDGSGGGSTATDLVAVKRPPAVTSDKAMSDKDPDDGDKGTVLLPSRASGHRIFVDGRRAKTDGVAPLHLRCGAHVIQIGSAGTPEPIDLPCRGEVQLQ